MVTKQIKTQHVTSVNLVMLYWNLPKQLLQHVKQIAKLDAYVL